MAALSHPIPLGHDLVHIAKHRAKALRKAYRTCHAAPDEHEVHALRVAARRLLPVLDVWRVRHRRRTRELRRLARALLAMTGPLREAHVRRETVVREQDAHLRGRPALLDRIQKKQRRERRALCRRMDRLGTSAFRHLDQLLRPLSGKQAHHALDQAWARLRKRLLRTWGALRADDPATLHRARIALKHYHYFLLAFTAHLPARATREIASLERMQATLGRLHDDRQLLCWLRSLKEPPREWSARIEERSARRTRRFLRAHGRSAPVRS